MKRLCTHSGIWTFVSILFFAFNSSAQLSGTYTIGGMNPDFPTISTAIMALENPGINGPVVFDLRDGTYNESFKIDSIKGSSTTNHVTFKSESGDSTRVRIEFPCIGTEPNWELDGVSNLSFIGMSWRNTATVARWLFEMDGVCNRIVFKSNVFSTNAMYEDILYLHPDQADSIWIIQNRFAGPIDEAIYISTDNSYINDVDIIGNLFTDTVEYCIYVYGVVNRIRIIDNASTDYTYDFAELEYCNDITIRNIQINYAVSGVYLYDDRDIKIENVTIEKLRDYGIETDYVYGFEMFDCHFKAVPNVWEDAVGLYGYEIHESATMGIRVEDNTFFGFNAGEHGMYLEYIYGTPTQKAIFANNAISGFDEGLYLSGDIEHSLIAHNSFNVHGQDNYPLSILNSSYVDVVLKNNIISNVGTGAAEAIEIRDTSNLKMGELYLDYNIYNFNASKKFSNFHTDLSDMQATGMDIHSSVDDPLFYSDSSNLRICNLSLHAKGDTCREVSHDEDGLMRPIIPTPGAYETDSIHADYTTSIDQLKVTFSNTTTGSATQYLWDFGDGNTSNDKDPVHTYTSAANYRIKLVASNPICGFSDSVSYYLNTVGLDPGAQEESVKIYPNPTTGLITLEFANLKADAELQVFDLKGMNVHQALINQSKTEINLNGLPSGMYLIRLSQESGTISRKILMTR